MEYTHLHTTDLIASEAGNNSDHNPKHPRVDMVEERHTLDNDQGDYGRDRDFRPVLQRLDPYLFMRSKMY